MKPIKAPDDLPEYSEEFVHSVLDGGGAQAEQPN